MHIPGIFSLVLLGGILVFASTQSGCGSYAIPIFGASDRRHHENRPDRHRLANQVRLGLFIMAYNLGNFLRRLVLPESMKHWSLTSLQTRMIKTGGRLVRHARRLVFQLAEVLVSREMLCGILERIGRLRLAPG